MEILKNVELLRKHIMLKYGSDKRATADNYCRCLWRFLNHFKEYPEPKAVNDDLIVEYLLAIPGRSNRCTHHSAIKKFYFLKGQVHKFKYIPYPEKEDKLPVHVNKGEFLKMIGVCKNNKHRAIIALMFDSGLRVSEVVNLKIQDLDESNMLINVVQGKGRKDRKVKLTKVLLGILKDYMSEYNPIIYLFNGQAGAAQYSIKSCQEVVKQLTAKAGIEKHFTPHKFRHGFAMNLLENGEGLDRIGNQLGHHSAKTTEIYARMNNKVIQDIESPLEQIMREDVSSKLLSSGNMETQPKAVSTMYNKVLPTDGSELKKKLENPDAKKNLADAAETIHKILFNGKELILKSRNKRIYEASEGAKWSEGVYAEKALAWYERKGGVMLNSQFANRELSIS